ncbi:MAG: TrkA family potassium uptake protein [Planctomycetales bacterium]|nr:TrkA family potassium uptake protein [Planctomycetales bacterium]
MASKHFIVIGLGSFGAALALRLSRNGCRVTGVDESADRVEELKDQLYEGMIADATEREVLEQLAVKDANAVFVSLGEDITRSLLATLHAKELGAKRIIVKGVTAEHGKLLRSLGVDRVIFPEIEIAESLADRMTWTNVVDFLPIDPEYSFMEIASPDAFAGKTLIELNLRKRFGIWVVGVKDPLSGKLDMLPGADYQLQVDQLLLVIGKHDDLKGLREPE